MEGFLNRPVVEKGETAGYDLIGVAGETAVPFLRRRGPETWQRTGPYRLVPEGLAEAERIIARSGGIDLLVVDEIGPLEMKGGGLWPALQEQRLSPSRHAILVVREKLLEELRCRLECAAEVYDVREEGTLSRMIDAVTERRSKP
jgi:nucleoside-triphosphatase THEP1